MSHFDSYMDLFKAKRDISKLVQVERTVTNKNGTTFTRKYYVQPNEVLKTDKVIGNQQVLAAWKTQLQNPPQKGVLDTNYFDAIKHDKDKALKYLRECGLTWKPDSHPAINWMHAMQSYTKAAKNAPTQTTTPKTTSVPTQVKTTPTSQAQSTSNAVKLTDAQQKEIDACKNGRDKVVTIKKLIGRDGCMEYARSLGVKWDEHQHPAINNMRMSTALTAYFDQKDGTASPNKTGGKKGKGGGAPLGNDNAKKDTPAPAPQPVVEPEEIEITKDMKPREIAIANLLNKVTSKKDLALFKSIGIVAEDDGAKTFIEKQLHTGYYKKDDSRSRRSRLGGGNYTSEEFGKSSAEGLNKYFKGIPKKLLKKGIAKTAETVSIAGMLYPRDTHSPFQVGYRANDVSVGMSMADGMNSSYTDMMTELHSTFSTLSDEDNRIANGTQTRASAGIKLGDSGVTPEMTKAQFDKHGVESYGVAKIISEVADRQPEVKAEADKMIEQYSEMLAEASYDQERLSRMVSSKYDDMFVTPEKKLRIKAEAVNTALETLKSLKAQYNLDDMDIYTTLYNANRGWGDFYLVDKNKDYVYDASGNRIDLTEILRNIPMPNDPDGNNTWSNFGDYYDRDDNYTFLAVMYSTGKSYMDVTKEDLATASEAIKKSAEGVQNPQWSGDTLADRLTGYKPESVIAKRDDILSNAKVTPKQYCDLRTKFLQFTGQKVVKYNDTTKTYEDVDTSQWSTDDWKEFDEDSNRYYSSWSGNSKRPYQIVSDGANPAKDVILANMEYALVNSRSCRTLSDSTPYDCPVSAANEQGNNHKSNFDYLSTTQTRSSVVTKYTGEGDPMTSAEVNATIDKNISETPMIDSKRLGDLLNYVNSHAEDVSSYVADRAHGDTNLKDTVSEVAKASQFGILYDGNLDALKGTPMYDIMVEQLQSMAVKCPQIKNARVKTDSDVKEYIAKATDFTPYSPEIDDDSTSDTLKGAALKKAREEALAKAHCSLASASQQDYDNVDKRVKRDWDKEKRNSSGRRLYGHISFVNHGVYEIKNSEQQDIFEETKQKTGGKVTSLFHGTDFRGGAGILGVTGKWLIPKDPSDAARMGIKYAGGMLGRGVYLADLAGKSAGYFGQWGGGYGRGSLLICDAILGNCVQDTSYGMVKNRYDCDSVCMKAGTNTGRMTLRADEWCVRSNDHVAPRFIIDAEAKNR